MSNLGTENAYLRSRWLSVVLPGLVAILGGLLPSLLSVVGTNSHSPDSFTTNTSDALVFRASAELLAEGRSPYDTALQEAHVAATRLHGGRPPYTLPFAYPPNALPLFLVYLIGSPRAACTAFVLATTTAMLLAAWLMVGQLVRDPTKRMLTMLAIGSCGAVRLNAQLGQTGALLAFTAFGYVACYSRRPVVAGVLLGLMAFKPQYALPLGLVALIEGRWRLMVSAGAMFAACTLASGVLFGFAMWGDFVHAAAAANHTRSSMCNWFAPLIALGYDQTVEAMKLPVMMIGVLAVGALGVSGRRSPERAPGAIAFAAVLSVIFSPNTHPYDLLLVVPAIVIWAARRSESSVLLWVVLYSVTSLLILLSGQRWMLTFLTAGVLLLSFLRPARS